MIRFFANILLSLSANFFLSSFFRFVPNEAFANTRKTPHVPISHCYHWLNEETNKYLTFKYSYAETHEQELTFFTTPQTSNGAVAGPGLYCAKSPSGSYAYGDRLIRIDFVGDVVVLDGSTNKQYCGHDGNNFSDQQECDKQAWDVKMYNDGGETAWYLIQNPMAIYKWSANDKQLINDLEEESTVADSSYTAHAQKTIALIKDETAKIPARTYINRKARMNFLRMYKESAAAINSLPSTQILNAVSELKDNELSPQEKSKIIYQAVLRVLKDKEISFADIAPLIKKNENIENEFFRQIKSIVGANPTLPNALNTEVAFFIINQKKFQTGLSQSGLQSIISRAFDSEKVVKRISRSTVALEPFIANGIKIMLTAETAALNPESLTATQFSKLNQRYQLVKNSLKEPLLEKRIFNLLTKYVDFNNKRTNLFINEGSKKFALSRKFDEALLQCKVYLDIFDLKEKELKVNFKSDFNFILGPSEKNEGSEDFCDRKKELIKTFTEISEASVAPGVKTHIITGRIKHINSSTSTIATIPFLFAIRHIDEITGKILGVFAKTPGSVKSDEVYISIDGSPEKKNYLAAGYWDISEVAGLFIQEALAVGLSTKEQTLEDFEMKKAGTKKKFLIQGMVQNFPIRLAADTLNEVEAKCLKLIASLDTHRVDLVRLSQDGQTYQDTYFSSGYWKTTAEHCDAVKATAAKLTPSIPANY